MKKSELIFTAALVPLDWLMLMLAGLSAYFLRTSDLVNAWRPVLFSLNLSPEKYLGMLLFFSLFFLFIFALNGLYEFRKKTNLLDELFKVLIATSAGFISIIIYGFFRREWFDSRFIILIAWLLAFIYVFLGRFLIRKIQKFLISRYRLGSHKTVVIGKDDVARRFIAELKNRPELGYAIIAWLDDLDLDNLKAVIKNQEIDDIILTNLDFARDDIVELINFCEDKCLNFKFIPNLVQALTVGVDLDISTGLPLLELKKTPLDGWGQIIKRALDITGALIGIIFLAPLGVLIALFIKIDSAGPIFARLKRVSQGREFYLYKFRSMVHNAEELKEELLLLNERKDGPLFKIKDDPRITRAGKFLRRTRLDELPQLFNVWSGEMSLVGPRPHQPDEVVQYQRHHKKLLAIKSGITGMAQTSGSAALLFEDEVKLDTYYIENWSLLMDLKLLFRTFWILLTDQSAY